METYTSCGMEPLPAPKQKNTPTISIRAVHTVPEHLEKFIGKVRVYHICTSKPRAFVGIYDENTLLSISTAAQEELPKQDANQPPKALLVSNVDKDQLYYILTVAVH